MNTANLSWWRDYQDMRRRRAPHSIYRLFLKQWIYSLTIKFNSMFVFLGGHLWRCFSSWLPNWNSSIITSYFYKSTWNSILWNKNYIFKVEMAIPKFQIEFWNSRHPHIPAAELPPGVSHAWLSATHLRPIAVTAQKHQGIQRQNHAILTYGYLCWLMDTYGGYQWDMQPSSIFKFDQIAMTDIPNMMHPPSQPQLNGF